MCRLPVFLCLKMLRIPSSSVRETMAVMRMVKVMMMMEKTSWSCCWLNRFEYIPVSRQPTMVPSWSVNRRDGVAVGTPAVVVFPCDHLAIEDLLLFLGLGDGFKAGAGLIMAGAVGGDIQPVPLSFLQKIIGVLVCLYAGVIESVQIFPEDLVVLSS